MIEHFAGLPSHLQPSNLPHRQERHEDALLQSLKDILPMAEAYLAGAPSHPDNAKLETARALVKGHL